MKIKYIAVAAVASVLLSCSDDILDKKPLNSLSELEVFNDKAALTNYVNTAYVGLRHPFDDENSLTDGLTDNAYNQHGSAAGTINAYVTAEVSRDNGEGITRNLWASAYLTIRKANLFFEKTESSSVDPVVLNQLKGEMRYIRAFLYFDLLRWYGGVPLITKTYGLTDEFEVTRNTADEVAAFIVSECDAAAEELLAISDAGYQQGRASKESAMALKGRTLLYIASPLFNPSNDLSKWQAARDANKAVMDLTSVSLVDTPEEYGAMFRGENSEEVIFARYFTLTQNQGWGINLWLMPNSTGGWANTTPTQNLVDDYELTSGEVPAEDPAYDPQNPYVNRDPRFYQSILYNGAPFKGATYDNYRDKSDTLSSALAGKDSRFTVASNSPHNGSKTGYNFRKWIQESKDAYSGNTGPWIAFRLAEFYLNYAEAQIALGEEGEAQAAINAVRSRVNMPYVTESGDELLERYRRERRIELVLEDHRFFDMRRWMIGDETLGSQARGVNVYKNGATFEYKYIGVSGTLPSANDSRLWHEKMNLLPIPYAEIQRSNNTLTQNPGYIQ